MCLCRRNVDRHRKGLAHPPPKKSGNATAQSLTCGAYLVLRSLISHHACTVSQPFTTILSWQRSTFVSLFTAVVFLHIASRSQRHGFNDELMDILATACGQFTDTRRYPNSFTSTSLLSLNKAAKLMKVVANKSLSTMSLVEIELSKSYLYRALRCTDFDSDSIYSLANVYLAVLYYTTGQYQTAMDHCTVSSRSHDHSQCSSDVVQGDILPKIDDDDSVLGLAELYQSVQNAALKQQRQPQLVSIFTTKLLAYHLRIKYLLLSCQLMQTSSVDEFKQYEICISDIHYSAAVYRWCASVFVGKSAGKLSPQISLAETSTHTYEYK